MLGFGPEQEITEEQLFKFRSQLEQQGVGSVSDARTRILMRASQGDPSKAVIFHRQWNEPIVTEDLPAPHA